jgi:hypothetical protein
MGVLDDAIRQHLELKRQHGVPEEELRRQEEEALGPARRDVAPADSGDGDAAAAPELHDQETTLQEPEGAEAASPPTEESPVEPAPFDSATELLPPDGEGEAATPDAAAEQPAAEDVPSPHVADADMAEPRVAGESAGEHSAPEQEAFGAEDSSDDSPEDPPREPAGDTLPSGFENLDEDELLDEDEHDADVLDEADADVLEDTPDFLQETPEHDRLWFEQKPPRDFDFD